MTSAKSVTVYKRLKKLLQIKKIMHGLHNMFYFERKKHAVFLLFLFVGICLLQCSFSFLADFLTVFFLFFFLKGIKNCHKMLCLRCYRDPKSSSVCTKRKYIGKQSYSSVWQKITIVLCEFNVQPLYLIFKI